MECYHGGVALTGPEGATGFAATCGLWKVPVIPISYTHAGVELSCKTSEGVGRWGKLETVVRTVLK